MRSPQGKYKQTSKGAVMLQPKADELRFVTKNDGCVNVHPSSVNYPVGYVYVFYAFIYIEREIERKVWETEGRTCSK